MRAQTVLALTASLVLGILAKDKALAADQVPWASNITSAQRLAAQRNKLVLIHFWSPDCVPCRRLESTVFSQESFGRMVSTDYVPVKVNVKQYPSVAYQYGVNRWPMDVITTPGGRVVHKMVSPPDAQAYSTVLAQAASRQPANRMPDAHLAARSVQPTDSPYRPSVARTRPAEAEAGLTSYQGPDGNYFARSPERHAGDYRARPSMPTGNEYGSREQPREYGPRAQPYDDDFSRVNLESSYREMDTRVQENRRFQPPQSAEIQNKYASRYRAETPPAVDRSSDVSGHIGPEMSARPSGPASRDRQSVNGGRPNPPSGNAPRHDYASRQLEPARNAALYESGVTPSSYLPYRQQSGGGTATAPHVGSSMYSDHGHHDEERSRPSIGNQQMPNIPGRDPANSRSTSNQQNRHASDPSLGGDRARNERSGQPARARTNPTWGLEGYCPVTLVEHSKWQKGNPQWGIVHRGRTYLFSDAEAKQRFWANPDRYSPVLSGLDPVLFTDAGQHAEGKRNHGVVYRDSVYLFFTEESLQRFWRSPERYAQHVRQATLATDHRNDGRYDRR